MKLAKILLASLLVPMSILALVYCSPAKINETPTPKPLIPTLSATPSEIPTTTSSPTNTPDISRYSRKCVEFLDTQPSTIKLNGTLVIKNYEAAPPSYLWDADTDQKYVLGNISISDIAISPSGIKLAFWDIDRSEVVISDAQGNKLKSISDPEERYTPLEWLDEERLVLNYRKEREWGQYNAPDSLIVFNTSTNARQEFSPDYPNFDDWPNSVFWNGYSLSRMVVHPSLEQLAYKAHVNLLDRPVILWNTKLNQEIVRIHQFYIEGGVTSGAPKWSPSGDVFVTSAQLRYEIPSPSSVNPVIPLRFANEGSNEAYINLDDDYPYIGGFELISVSQSGEIKRLSYLTTTYRAMESNWAWSPDGKKIAFWLEFLDDRWGEPELAILNVDSGEVENLCITTAGTPIWSPDGNQIIINQWADSTSYINNVQLIDLEEEITFTLLENVTVGGWMNQSP